MLYEVITKTLMGLVLVLLAVSLAACGSGSNNTAPTISPAGAGNTSSAQSSESVEIEFWNIWGGELIDSLVNEYNSSQDKVKVKAVYVQNSYEGIVEKLQVQAAAKKLPDIVSYNFV